MEARFIFDAFVLAGGKSSRMGTDKGLIEFHGKKMIEHVLDALQSSSHTSIISNNEEYAQFGRRVYSDIYKNCGPLGGIHSALFHSTTDWCLVSGCDMPMITSDFIIYLLEKIGESGKVHAIVPVHDNNVEPLCALYNKSCLPEIEKLILKKELKMEAALEKLNTVYVEIPIEKFDPSILFRNVNSPSDIPI